MFFKSYFWGFYLESPNISGVVSGFGNQLIVYSYSPYEILFSYSNLRKHIKSIFYICHLILLFQYRIRQVKTFWHSSLFQCDEKGGVGSLHTCSLIIWKSKTCAFAKAVSKRMCLLCVGSLWKPQVCMKTIIVYFHFSHVTLNKPAGNLRNHEIKTQIVEHTR